MRLPFFLTFAVLSACSTEPSPTPPADVPVDNPCATAGQPCGCAGVPVRQGVLECVGGGVVCVCATPDAGAVDTPATMDASDASPVDALATDRAAPALDVASAVDVPTEDRPSPRDVPTPDVPPGECAEVERSCTTNADCAMCTPVRGMAWCCGRNAGRSFCMVPDANGFCAGVTITPTVQCADLTIVRCRNHADCAMCFPAASGEPWCCAASNGECGWSPGRRACP
jgi:hypothetical protein